MGTFRTDLEQVNVSHNQNRPVRDRPDRPLQCILANEIWIGPRIILWVLRTMQRETKK